VDAQWIEVAVSFQQSAVSHQQKQANHRTVVRPQNSVDRLNKAILAVGAAKSSKHLAHSTIWKYPDDL
jgi:hypothetical protein